MANHPLHDAPTGSLLTLPAPFGFSTEPLIAQVRENEPDAKAKSPTRRVVVGFYWHDIFMLAAVARITTTTQVVRWSQP